MTVVGALSIAAKLKVVVKRKEQRQKIRKDNPMDNDQLPQEVISEVKSWKGFENFDGTNIDFRNEDPEIFENHQGTILMEAVQHGELSTVKALINAGADANAVNIGTQQVPLLCFPDNITGKPLPTKTVNEITKELIKAGANVNYIQKHEDDKNLENHFWTPLIDACSEGRAEQVKLLIDAGADANLCWQNGLTAICMVDHNSKHYIKILKELIRAGADVNACDGSALQTAIRESNPEAIKLLLNSGASLDISSTDKAHNGRTPFMSFLKGEAVDLGADEEQELFLLFCKNMGDVNAQDNDGKNLLAYALDTYIGDDGFDLFVFDQILFSGNIDVHQTDHSGNTNLTSLLLSMENDGYPSDELYDDERYKIESLLIAGSDIDIRNKKGESPKIIAKRMNNETIQSLLEDCDKLINTENYLGRTPLFIACLQGYTEKAIWLIKKEAYVNTKNKCHKIPRGMDMYGTFVQTHEETRKPKFYTALMVAQNLEIIKALIKAGAEINEKNSDGDTALMLYAKDDYLEGVRELIAAGANTNLVNKRYQTALMVAKRNGGSEELVRLLQENTTGNFISWLLSTLLSLFRTNPK